MKQWVCYWQCVSWILGLSSFAYAGKAPIDPEWHLKQIHLREAFALFEAVDRRPGEGITIGHPDTGISAHPELAGTADYPDPVRRDHGWDFVDGDADAEHEWPALRAPRHGHGTETASIMVSPPGCPVGWDDGKPCVSGVAPAAQLIPYRVSNTVILGSGERLAMAIEKAIQDDVHVLSISMGGVFDMLRLEQAVQQAHRQGIIIVAAAGNSTGPIVVRPAAYPEAIAVGAVTEKLQPWWLSAFGRKVDVSAPGTAVVFAKTTRSGKQLLFSHDYAQGTSDATALTAGAAALWLSYHGRDALIARYGKENLVEVFRRLLVSAGVDRPTRWDTQRHGAGILNIEALLKAPLPQ